MSTTFKIIDPAEYGTADKVKARTAALVDEARTLTRDDLTGDDVTRFEAIEAELDELRRHGDLLDRVARVASNPANVESGDGTVNAGPQIVRRAADPWQARDNGSPDDLHERALVAAERMAGEDTARTRTGELLEAAAADPRHNPDNLTERWVLATSDPAYGRAFDHVLRDPIRGHLHWSDEERHAFTKADKVRAALSLTDANGGYLVPTHLDPSVFITNAGIQDPMRQVANSATIASDVWHGVTSTGVTAEWHAEAADASPTFGGPSITVHSADAYVQASFEVVNDATNLGNEVAQLIADAKMRLEGAAWINGTGTGQPYGVVSTLAVTTASRVAATTNSSFGEPDVYLLADALPARWHANASWMANWQISNRIRRFSTSANGTFWVDLGQGTPPTLLGKPYHEASEMTGTLSAATASNDDVLVLGDFRNYTIVDRVGLVIAYEPLVKGANRRPTGEVGWYAWWRTGGAISGTTDGFRLLRV